MKPLKRPRETMTEYETRAARWRIWKGSEPLVDLSTVNDTEVAEYRRWAGTKAHHDRVVEELIELAKQRE